MDEKRKGEIALKILETMLMKRQIPAPNDFMRELGNVAKEIGEDTETLKQFYEALLPKMLGRMLGRKSVSMTSSN